MGLYPHILIGDRRPLTHSLSLSFLLSHSPPARAHLSSGACQTMGRIAMGGPKYKCHFARHLALATPVALVSLPSSPFLSLTTSLSTTTTRSVSPARRHASYSLPLTLPTLSLFHFPLLFSGMEAGCPWPTAPPFTVSLCPGAPALCVSSRSLIAPTAIASV